MGKGRQRKECVLTRQSGHSCFHEEGRRLGKTGIERTFQVEVTAEQGLRDGEGQAFSRMSPEYCECRIGIMVFVRV